MAEFAELWSSHFTVHREVLPLVEALHGRVKLVLLSNTNWLHVRWFEPRLPILERFDARLYSCALGRVKPEPEIYLEALRAGGVSRPERALFFDDIAAYVDAARGVGLRGEVFSDAQTFARQLASYGL